MRTLSEASKPIAQCVGSLWSCSASMRAVFERIRRIASSSLPALIFGETGSGKELVARALHEESARRTGPFVAINCGALAASLVESELFGHVKGSFTGAAGDKAGVFEAADGGTLFLDEIGELPLEMQPRLLRVLEARAIRRIGGSREIAVDVRVVAATHRDLAAMVRAGQFREDLYHRLMILDLRLPALRERPEDILFLAARFLEEAGARAGLSAEAERALVEYRWPGNVRELRNVIARAAVLCEGPRIEAADLELAGEVRAVSDDRGALRAVSASSAVIDDRGAVRASFAEMTLEEERRALMEMLRACGGNRSRAARRLGISRSALHERLKKLGVPPRFQARRRPLLAVV